MNLQPLQRSQDKPVSGDVFAMHLRSRGWLFGRVIATDARVGFMEDPSLLLYVYRQVQDECRVPNDLSPKLLIPPQLTSSLPWSKGLFTTIAHVPLRKEHVLPVHCFYDVVRKRYYNERNRELPKRTEPCGIYALTTVDGIDDEISRALGVKVTLQEEKDAAPISMNSLAATGDSECSVVLYLPSGSEDQCHPYEVEEVLIEAVEKKNEAGVWVGHGTYLETGTFDVQFVGPDCRALLVAIQQGLAPLRNRLPSGWYVTVQIGEDGEELRVTL